MANFSSFFPAASTGGGAIPQTEIFTSSGIWLVPQDVQDKITNDGHADIGILAVGGANSANNSGGEVRNEILKLTSSTYSPSGVWANSNQPEISVTVGAAAGDSGIGYDTTAGTQQVTFGVTSSSSTSGALPAGSFTKNASDQIKITEVFITVGRAYAGGASISGASYNGTDSPTITTSEGHSISGAAGTYGGRTFTWSSGTFMDGTASISSNRGTIGVSWNTSARTFSFGTTQDGGLTRGHVIYQLAPGAPTIKAESGDGTVANFRNNPTSTEGYLGFSRQGSLRPGSAGGSSAQGGYVQIFF